jgi:hypothetical protein
MMRISRVTEFLKIGIWKQAEVDFFSSDAVYEIPNLDVLNNPKKP